MILNTSRKGQRRPRSNSPTPLMIEGRLFTHPQELRLIDAFAASASAMNSGDSISLHIGQATPRGATLARTV